MLTPKCLTYSEIGRAVTKLAIHALCYEMAAPDGRTPIDDLEIKASIQQLLQTKNPSGFDEIPILYFNPDRSFSGIAIDQISPKREKRYAFKVGDSQFQFRLINPQEVQDFSETLEFASSGRKQAKCVKGVPCDPICLRPDYSCLHDLDSSQKKSLKRAQAKAATIVLKNKDKPLAVRAKYSSKKRQEKLDALTQKYTEDRFEAYKQSENTLATFLIPGTGGLTYNKIKASQGEVAADAALKKAAARIAPKIAESDIKREEIEYEKKQILAKGTTFDKTRLQAFRRLHRDRDYTQTLADFSQSDPELYNSLLERFAAETKKDKTFSRHNLIKRGQKLIQPFSDRITRADSYDEQLGIMQEFRASLIKSGLSPEAAAHYAGDIDIKSSVKTLSTKQVRDAATEFFQVSGGAGKKTLNSFVENSDRGFADATAKLINIGSSGKITTIWHEMGHHVEFEDPRIAASAKDWIQSRATGAPQKLNDLTWDGYEEHEIAIPDHFAHPYVGKIYTNASTEVVSMGLERLSSAEAMLEFHASDREHLAFVLGLIRPK